MKIGLSALLAIGLLAACNSKETKNDNPATEQQATSQGEEATFPLTMTDVTGKDITLEAPPERIISLIPSNTAADTNGWYKIDAEQIIAKNPDVIVVTYNYVPDILTKIPQRAGFDTMNAVKNKAIVQVDENMISRQGPRLADGLEELAKAIYPEAFE